MLTIGFSDQVPLWAKAESSRDGGLLMKSFQVSQLQDRKQFQLFRKDLLEAVDFFDPERCVKPRGYLRRSKPRMQVKGGLQEA